MQQTKFKQTEIGEIPVDWSLEPFGEVAYLSKDVFDPKKSWQEKTTVYLGLEHFCEGGFALNGVGCSDGVQSNKFRFASGDVLFGKLRPYFKKVYSPKFNGVCSTDIWVLRAKQDIDQKFLYFLVGSDTFLNKAVESSEGTRMPRASWGFIANYKFPIPLIDEQQRIASILSSLDDKIELNKKMNKTLGEIGKALFKRWFVDFEFFFDFVQGKSSLNSKSYKSGGGKMVDSDLGRVPEGWEVKPLDTIATFLNGVACQKYPPIDELGLPVIKIAELHNGITESSDQASSSIASDYIVDDGDVLFSWSGSLEVVLWTGGRGILNQHLFKVISKNYPKWFYYLWTLKYLSFFREIASNKATTMGHIQRRHLSESLVLVPTAKILEKMDQIMTPLLDKIIASSREINFLSNVRDSLLPRLMSGRLRV